MEINLGTRKIDELGRFVLPKELRCKPGWDMSDQLIILYCDDTQTAVLKPIQGSRCLICNSDEKAITINGKNICGDCLTQIKNL